VNILEGYQVLDLTDEKGLLCPKLLANMGAEVIRIEEPGCAVSRIYANGGKHCISLNIRTQKGQALFKRLVKDTDIIVESFSPGYLASMELNYDSLSRSNPRLIMASITHFGQTGPFRDYKSSDLVASALGGQMYVCGEPGKPPLKPFGSQAYSNASLFAANGILLAIWRRHTSGKGQYIDISIHECLAASLDHVLVRYFYEEVVAERQGSLYWNNAFRIFPCQNGYILLSIFYQWETLMELLDSEGMADDLRENKYRDRAEIENNLDHVIAILERWTLRHSVNELVELGQLMHFPWANIASIPEVVNNPQLQAREFFKEEFSDPGKSYQYPGAPVKMSESAWQINPRIPITGEYNREIYLKRSGLADEEMEDLARDGVI
jgi:crotonobetainyl-CoA:carnitine CoA-transferase CaiB-like acyl-CoA transferase